MRTGRNDACPCGSGKKFKRCCLNSSSSPSGWRSLARKVWQSIAGPGSSGETETSATSTEPLPAAEQAAGLRVDPAHEPAGRDLDASLESFQREDSWSGQPYEKQIESLLKMLERPAQLDGEAAFRLLSRIQPQARRRGEVDRSDAIVLALSNASANVRHRHGLQLLRWRISNALAAGRFDVLLSLAEELARAFPDDVESGLEAFHELEYHGQLPRLVDIARRAWPQLATAKRIPRDLRGEFVRSATLHEIFQYLERSSGEPAADDPELLAALEPLVDDPSSLLLDDFVSYLAATQERRWQPDQFMFREAAEDEAAAEDEPDPARQQLYFLSLEFLGYLRRREGVAYTKGELGRAHLLAYLLERQDGGLGEAPEEPDWKLNMRVGAAISLCPDRRTLDAYLSELLDPQQPLAYQATALFELLPAWLRFLDAQGLITSAQRYGVLEDIAPMQRELLRFMEQQAEDPALSRALKAWRLNAERELVVVR